MIEGRKCPAVQRQGGEGSKYSALVAGGGRGGARLPRSAVELDLEGGVGVCQVGEEGRTLLAPGTVCAKAGDRRI